MEDINTSTTFNCNCFNREFREKNKCEFCTSQGKLQIPSETRDFKQKFECPHPGENRLIKIIGEVVTGHIGAKMTKGEISKDRKKRATGHFQKEILPDLAPGTIEHKHFSKKYPGKLKTD